MTFAEPQGIGSGTGGGGGHLVGLDSKAPSGVATVDFVSGIDSTYDVYVFKLTNVVPVTDNVKLHLVVSNDGGGSFVTAANSYTRSEQRLEGGTSGATGSTGDTEVELTSGISVGSAANEGLCGTVWMFDPGDSSKYTKFIYHMSYESDEGAQTIAFGKGVYLTAEAIDAIRFLFSSGNVESGKMELYGLERA